MKSREFIQHENEYDWKDQKSAFPLTHFLFPRIPDFESLALMKARLWKISTLKEIIINMWYRAPMSRRNDLEDKMCKKCSETY